MQLWLKAVALLLVCIPQAAFAQATTTQCFDTLEFLWPRGCAHIHPNYKSLATLLRCYSEEVPSNTAMMAVLQALDQIYKCSAQAAPAGPTAEAAKKLATRIDLFEARFDDVLRRLEALAQVLAPAPEIPWTPTQTIKVHKPCSAEEAWPRCAVIQGLVASTPFRPADFRVCLTNDPVAMSAPCEVEVPTAAAIEARVRDEVARRTAVQSQMVLEIIARINAITLQSPMVTTEPPKGP